MIAVRNRWQLVGGCVAALVASVAVWWVWRTPPGKWMTGRSVQKIRVAWAKEREWSRQVFTPIRDDEQSLGAVRLIRTRVETTIHPEQLDQLYRILYGQLLCRHSGSLDCYRKRFVPGRQNPLDEDSRAYIEAGYQREFHAKLGEHWRIEDVFEQFWNREYGEHRFKEVALGPDGSLIAIGEVRDALALPPEFFLTEEELRRWNRWPGASMRGSVRFHPGARSLESIIEQDGRCTYAQVVMIVRSINDEVWCWETNWYLDPADNHWEIHGAIAITLRVGYYCPM